MATKPLLSGPIHAEPVEPDTLREEFDELRQEFNDFRAEMELQHRQLIAVLQSGRVVFGGVPSNHAEQPNATAPQPHNREAWEMWKRNLPGPCSRIIDALLIQPLTQTQLVTAAKMDRSNVCKMLMVMKRNNLIEMDGKVNRLKRL